jgi:aspartate carbamoyltransferase catalytic subunit
MHGLQALGVGDLRVCGPAELLPELSAGSGVSVHTELDSALEGVDVVIGLRLQKERMEQAMIPGEAEYFRRYGLTAERMRRAARDAIVMHPGPMNRGIERIRSRRRFW